MRANGFVRRSLMRRRRRTAATVQRVADQVESADPLDGQDPALPDKGGRFGDTPGARPARPRVDEAQAGAANGAGDGLGVVPPVEGVSVFPRAIGAHGKSRHGRRLPVVGEVPDDRVAGAAVRAVGESVSVTTLSRRADLLEAVVADGDIGGDEDEARRSAGLPDLEAVEPPGPGGPAVDPLDPGQGRLPFFQGLDEPDDGGGAGRFEEDLDALPGVLDPARKAQLPGQPVDERPEADALNDPEDREGGGATRPGARRLPPALSLQLPTSGGELPGCRGSRNNPAGKGRPPCSGPRSCGSRPSS